MTSTAAPVHQGFTPGVTTRVLLVDDRPLVRAGLTAILEGSRAEVRTAGTLDEAVSSLGRDRGFRSIVVAVHLVDSTAWCRLAAAAPGVTLVALGAGPRTGTTGVPFVPLAENAATTAIRAAVITGTTPTHHDSRGHTRRDGTAGCTPQEMRILRLIGEGLSNREIADRLGIAEKTVKNYITGLFAKLGVTRRTHAAAIAWRSGATPVVAAHRLSA